MKVTYLTKIGVVARDVEVEKFLQDYQRGMVEPNAVAKIDGKIATAAQIVQRLQGLVVPPTPIAPQTAVTPAPYSEAEIEKIASKEASKIIRKEYYLDYKQIKLRQAYSVPAAVFFWTFAFLSFYATFKYGRLEGLVYGLISGGYGCLLYYQWFS